MGIGKRVCMNTLHVTYAAWWAKELKEDLASERGGKKEMAHLRAEKTHHCKPKP